MKLLFFGSGAFGLPSLQHLAAIHEVLGVVSQPDRPAGRGKTHTPTPIAAWAQQQGLPVHKPENVNEQAIASELRALDAEVWVVIAFGQKLSQPLLEDRFAINLHASLLPRWRGAAPIHHAILAGDAETGNSVITLAERMDAGLVLGQSRRSIEPTHTTGALHDILADDGPALLKTVLAQHEAGESNAQQQDESLVTHAGKLRRADAAIDFSNTAEACRRQINGLSPWPGVAVDCAGTTLKLLRATCAETAERSDAPGTITQSHTVACGNGTALQLLDVQPAGKRAMPWTDFARGAALSGAVLRSAGK